MPFRTAHGPVPTAHLLGDRSREAYILAPRRARDSRQNTRSNGERGCDRDRASGRTAANRNTSSAEGRRRSHQRRCVSATNTSARPRTACDYHAAMDGGATHARSMRATHRGAPTRMLRPGDHADDPSARARRASWVPLRSLHQKPLGQECPQTRPGSGARKLRDKHPRLRQTSRGPACIGKPLATTLPPHKHPGMSTTDDGTCHRQISGLPGSDSPSKPNRTQNQPPRTTVPRMSATSPADPSR